MDATSVGGTAAGAGPAVALKSSRFSPSNLTVPAGQTVTWDWKDRFVKHNVAGADFVSKTQRYSCRCTLHDKLTGTITVTAAK
jgi:plastocyanin